MEKDRYDILLKAIEAERAHEAAYFQRIAKEKSTQNKIKAGVLWQNAQINKSNYTLGEFIEIELERIKHLNVNHKFKSGVGVTVKLGNDDNILRGTIAYVKRNIMSVILTSDLVALSSISNSPFCQVELIFDEKPFLLMRKAIQNLKSSKEEHIRQMKLCLQTQKAELRRNELEHANYHNQSLNTSQNEAIKAMVNTENIGIIHGPPGTGKTTTLVALIKLLAKTEKQILVCAPSNNAVDLLADKLNQGGLSVLRIGNITRVGDKIGELTLNEKARSHEEWSHIKKVKIEADQAKKMALKFKRTFGQQERNDRKALLKEAKALRNWAKDLEERLMDKLIEEAEVICCTLVGSDNSILDGRLFKTLVIDEASQALEPECWIPMLKSKRVILAGDHKQLPPTIKSQEAKTLGLETTILDIMKNSEASLMLNIQYRMNDKILGFSNTNYYDNKLISADRVAQWKLSDTDPVASFIDTSGCGFDEYFNPEFKSLSNEGEYFILREHFLMNQNNYHDYSIGIISPYAEQVRFLKTKISEDEIYKGFDIEINSIDGFQGQEKDIIYISLVRSNTNSIIGFLKDQRRLNVALTRAKKKLVVIGDGATLTSENTYLKLIEYFEQKAQYQSAWEYMAG